jgi:acyl-CoA thioesterase
VAVLWDDLLACLKLRELSPAPAAVFEGENLHLSYHRLFGGQLLAQFARAAALTCPGKTVKSLHALFPKEGQSGEPVRFEAQRHHEGKTFATLTIVARQSAGVIATASVSMHGTEDWLLLRQHSPLLAHGRTFGRGDVLTADGTLVASYAQEALLRFRR